MPASFRVLTLASAAALFLVATPAHTEPLDAAVDSIVKKALETWRVPGVAVAIVRNWRGYLSQRRRRPAA